jgi:CheY-like chemotaxis protein
MVALELLGNEGAQVQLAENGQLAVEALIATPEGFDLVLMDWQMPVMDGLQATRHIRQELKLTTLPIIAMTANIMVSDREACLNAGMNDHIGKPFNVQDLVKLLQKRSGLV